VSQSSFNFYDEGELMPSLLQPLVESSNIKALASCKLLKSDQMWCNSRYVFLVANNSS